MSADLFAAFLADGEKPKLMTTRKPAAQTTTATPAGNLDLQPSTPVRSIPQQTIQGKAESPLWRRDTHGSDVLFDAEETELDDDFGAFETVGDSNRDEANLGGDLYPLHSGNTSIQASEPPEPVSLVADLLETDDFRQQSSISRSNLPQEGIQPARVTPRSKENSSEPSWGEEWGDFEQIQITERPNPSPVKRQGIANPQISASTISDGPDEEWEPFEDGQPDPVQSAPPQSEFSRSEGKAQQIHLSRISTPRVTDRPTNIPPPSSLLQLLSSIFESIHKSNADKTKSKVELASKIVVVYRTASRILGGRTMRWKRDTILAQSVRIGQAGKSGGMKLASVNKSESTKEQRDSEEMIRDWSRYVHEFNSILAQADFPAYRMRLAASPALKTSKDTNTSASSKPCALCGLKRTERLSDIDVEVDDLFGEFWTEHWGHKECCEFWYLYKDLLGQR